MNVIFMGTPDFAVPVLQGLIDSDKHTVTAVVTQPDRARGRSGKLVPTPVKEVALTHGIDVYTPERVKDSEFVRKLKTIPCDVIVVVAFGQILSQDILTYPRYGCINVHASLLPRWRGAAPMQWAILSGDAKTGVTTMQMDVGLDTGDILLSAETGISDQDTLESLHDRMSQMGKELLLVTLDDIDKGVIERIPQSDADSCYAKMITKDLGHIDFEWENVKIDRYIRGLYSWPSAYTKYAGKTLKLWKAAPIYADTKEKPGTVVDVAKDGFTVQTGKGCIKLLEVQLEGKRRMAAGDFLRGGHLQIGDVLGS